ncbi:phage tail tip fiber protein, partial [Kistimonas scapharcae]|uniref:phage tail tip fiber protein n=1 Tax=Kistimonas scapharcae TaxID=1036133 RepID=UPI0031EEB408
PTDNALVNEAIPNNPANVKFTGTENYIIIDYAPPQDFVAHTEVWVSEDSELSNAVMVGVINTRPWGYKPDDNTAIYYFWLRHVSYRNKYSGFVSGSGSCDAANADDLTVNTLTVATATIGQGEIGNLLIGDAIQSDNYVPGVSGWIIKK